jgi:hypothetical protein
LFTVYLSQSYGIRCAAAVSLSMRCCIPLAIRSDPLNADLTLHYLLHCTTHQVENTWSIMSTKLDPDGWQYTTRLDSAYWYPQNDSSLCK